MRMLIGIIAQNLGSSDESRKVGGYLTDVACTLLGRDYKGFSNYGSNAVIVNEKIIYSSEQRARSSQSFIENRGGGSHVRGSK